MMSRYRKTVAAVLMFLFLSVCPVMAAGPSGSSSEDVDSNTMTYITIGIVVVVGGLLFLDVISDSGDEETVVSTEPDIQNIPTGIDWTEIFPSGTDLTSVAVSIFHGEDGLNTSLMFIEVLNDLASDEINVYADPLELGEGSAVDRARMAQEFFGVDYLIFSVDNTEILQCGIASPDSIVWTSPDQTGINIQGIVEEMLQSDVL